MGMFSPEMIPVTWCTLALKCGAPYPEVYYWDIPAGITKHPILMHISSFHCLSFLNLEHSLPRGITSVYRT